MLPCTILLALIIARAAQSQKDFYSSSRATSRPSAVHSLTFLRWCPASVPQSLCFKSANKKLCPILYKHSSCPLAYDTTSTTTRPPSTLNSRSTTLSTMDATSHASSMIPGYSIVAPLLLQHFGVDVGTLISKYLIVFAIYQVGIYRWERSSGFIQYVEPCQRYLHISF